MTDESVDQWLQNFNSDSPSESSSGSADPDPQPLSKDYSELDKVPENTPPAAPVSQTTANKQGSDIVQREEDLRQRTDRDRNAYYDKMEEMNKVQEQLDKQALGRAPQVQQANYQPPPNTDQMRTQALVKSLLFFGVGAAAALMLGKHNRFAMYGAMQGLGAGLNNIARGYKTEATEAMASWNKQNEYIKEENHQRIEAAKTILADNKLALSDKMKLLKTYAQGYELPYLRDAAERKDLNGTINELTKMEKVQSEYEKKAWQLNKEILPNESAEYEQAKEKDPNLKYSDFLRLKHMQQTRTKKKKSLTSEGTTGDTTSPSGEDIFGVTGDSEPSEDQKKAFEKTMAGE